jgi:hypothetical protein
MREGKTQDAGGRQRERNLPVVVMFTLRVSPRNNRAYWKRSLAGYQETDQVAGAGA